MVTKATKSHAQRVAIDSLTIKQLATLKNVSESAVKRWKDNKTFLAPHEGLYLIGKEPVILDNDFAEIITILNLKGYKTVACCSGHDFSPDCRPYIYFDLSCAPCNDFLPLSEISAIHKELMLHKVGVYFKSILDLNLGNDLDKYNDYLENLHKTLLKWTNNLPVFTAPKENSMRIYNVSTNKVNYSQRNNKVNPNKSCNTTSMVMAASYIPSIWQKFTSSELYKKYSKKFDQPEDCLQQYMLDAGLRPTYHEELLKAFNQFVGEKVTKFSMTVPLEKLIEEIKAGRPVVISGDFPKSNGKTLGHIVCLVGCIFNEGNSTDIPDFWIIDDPYGNTLGDWEGSGNDIRLPHDYFMKYIKEKGQGKKWAHTFIA